MECLEAMMEGKRRGPRSKKENQEKMRSLVRTPDKFMYTREAKAITSLDFAVIRGTKPRGERF